MWIEFLKELSSDVQFREPVLISDIEAAERESNLKLPTQLKDLLIETNGVIYSNNVGNEMVMPLDNIVSYNIEMRTHFQDEFMPFDHLLFFGRDNGGNAFGFGLDKNGEILLPKYIYSWCHETDGRVMITSGLQDYCKQWIKNELEY